MTTKDIFRAYSTGQDQKAKLEAEIMSLQNKQADAEKAMQEAAEAGDVDKYLQEKAVAERAAAEITVRSMQLKKAEHPVTMDQARQAWLETAKPLNKQLEKTQREYDQALTDLVDKFRRLISLNNQIVTARKDLASVVCPDLMNSGSLWDEFPAVITELNSILNDRQFFVRKKLLSPAEDQQIGPILYRPGN